MARKMRTGAKQKRWYVNATVGKNVPIIGGTGIQFGSGAKSKRALEQTIKRVVKRQVLQPKLHRTGNQLQASALHNTIYSYNIMRDIVVGTDEENRLADTINVKKWCAKFNFYVPAAGTAQEVDFRVLLVKSKVSNATAGWFSSALGSSDLFWSGTSNDLTNAMVNYTQCTVLHDSIVKIVPSISTGRLRKSVTLTHAFGKFVYEENVNTLGKDYQYYIIVIPYIMNGTTGVTTAGDFEFTGCTSFTDSK